MSKHPIPGAIFFDQHEAEFAEYKTPIEKCIKGQATQRTWNHFAGPDYS